MAQGQKNGAPSGNRTHYKWSVKLACELLHEVPSRTEKSIHLRIPKRYNQENLTIMLIRLSPKEERRLIERKRRITFESNDIFKHRIFVTKEKVLSLNVRCEFENKRVVTQ